MSKTVDQRVVSMQFDNSNFEKNVSTTMSTLDRFKKALHLDGATKGLENVNSAANKMDFSKTEIAATKAGFHIQDVFEKATRFLEDDVARRIIDVGNKIATEFTIDPITTGFNEFELKMGSVQTIMYSTGESLETVNKYLEELNTYSDKTIYSFSDMTNNIGKFTNAGVKLEDAVMAIKGISNEAAVSGANADEASRAMYNFAQALSAGYVKLIDWKSIENANMATVEFKNQLIQSAVAAGTLKDVGNGMYETYAGTLINATQNFNDSLQDQWMTTDVLVNTLKDYADETTEIGSKAFKAAQEVKTFSMMMDTLKEAAQSGWAQTWELVIGDFNEGKALWTNVAEYFGNIIDESSKARNQMIKDWKEAGGRSDLIDTLKNSWEGLLSVLKPIKEAFREVFPPTTGKRLAEITKTLKEFSEKLKLSDEQSKNLKSAFKGLFSLIGLGIDIFKTLAGGAIKIVGSLSGLFDIVLKVAGAIGGWTTNVREAANEANIFEKALNTIIGVFQLVIDKIKEFVSNINLKFEAPSFQKLVEILQSIWEFIGKIGSTVGKVFSSIGNAITEAFDFEKVSGALNIANGGLLAALLISLKKLISGGNLSETLEKLIHPIESLKDSLKPVTGILDEVKGCLTAWQSDLKASALLKIAGAIAILSASLWVLSTIDEKTLTTALGAITGLFIDLMASMSAFSKLNATGMKSMTMLSIAMIAMSTSVLILAAAVKVMSSSDPKSMFTGLAGVVVLLAATSKAMSYLSSNSGKAIKGATQMIFFAVAVRILASSCKSLSELNFSELAKGLLGTVVLIFAASEAMKRLSETKGLMKAGIGIMAMAVGIRMLASACVSLASLSLKELIKGLGGVIGLLMGVSAAANLVSDTKGLISAGIGIVAISIGIVILTSAVKSLGSIPIDQLLNGLVSVVGLLMSLALIMRIMPNNMISIGVGLIAVSTGLVIMSNAIKTMGSLSLREICKSMITLAVSMTILGIALNAMKGTLGGSASLLVASVALTVLSGVLKILGSMSIGSIVKSLVSLAVTLGIIGIAGALLSPVIPAILGLGLAMTLLGISITGIGAGLTLIATGFTALTVAVSAGTNVILAGLSSIILGFINLIPAIATSLANGIAAFCIGITNAIGPITTMLINLVNAICTVLMTCAPQIATTLLTLLVNLLTIIRDNIGQVVTIVVEVILNAIAAVREKIPDIIQAGIDFIFALIEGLGQAIEDNAERLRETMISFCEHIWNAILEFFGIHSPSTKMAEAGVNLILGLIEGIFSLVGNVVSAIANIGGKILSGIGSFASGCLSKGKELIGKVASGIASGASAVVNKAKSVISGAVGAVKGFAGKFLSIGGDLIGGLGKGIADAVGGVVNGVKKAAGKVVDGVKSFFGIHSPSKVFAEIGMYCDEGLAVGLEKYSGVAEKAAENLGGDTLGGISDSISQIKDSFSDINSQPTITPVLDLSEVQNGTNKLYSMMDGVNGYSINGSTNLANSAISSANNSKSSNNADLSATVAKLETAIKDIANRPTVLNNTFDIRGDDPTLIANEVSRILQKQVERRDAVWV